MPIGFTIIAIDNDRSIVQTTATGTVRREEVAEVLSGVVKAHQLKLVITAWSRHFGV